MRERQTSARDFFFLFIYFFLCYDAPLLALDAFFFLLIPARKKMYVISLGKSARVCTANGPAAAAAAACKK